MKADVLRHGRIDTLRLDWFPPDARVPASVKFGAHAQLIFVERDAQPLLKIGDDVMVVAGADRAHADILMDLCTQHLPRIVWIVEASATSIVVQVHTFLRTALFSRVEIGIDARALTRIPSRSPGRLAWLREEFVLEGPGGELAFVSTEIEDDASGFMLHGRTSRARIAKRRRADQADCFVIVEIMRGAREPGDRLALLEGEMHFLDTDAAAPFGFDVSAELNALAASGSRFLDVWERYGSLENEATLRRARKAGYLHYGHHTRLPDGHWRFHLKAGGDALALAERFRAALADEQGFTIEAVGRVPEELQGDLSWEASQASNAGAARARGVSFESGIEFVKRDATITLKRSSSEDTLPPDEGFLVVSLQGDKKRLERRASAKLAIAEARCPMPQLGLLLENRRVAMPRRQHIAPITPDVRRKVFGKYSPTPAQEEAVRVALNTPDIALIQGPPGTGKTTVIVALVERLQEVWDTTEGVQGNLLLSGFQHDAVENAIQRMNVNGLPPIKFGERSDRRGDTEHLDVVIERWCREHSEQIRSRQPARPASAIQRELNGLIEASLLAPGTLAQNAAMLLRAASLVQGHVGASLTTRMREIAGELAAEARVARQADPAHERLARAIRALRFEACPFTDDGARNAARLLRALREAGQLDARAQSLLEDAARWTHDSPPPFLPELRALRRRLLLAVLPADHTVNTVPRVHADTLDLLNAARDQLDRRLNASRDAADTAVWNFLEALEGDLESVKAAIVSCTSVFAATCQHSARQELAQLKGSQAYDTVVVDEAARATPLDLFIPMARARRRIVLVGDHRQLPHIVDRAIARELDDATPTRDASKSALDDVLNKLEDASSPDDALKSVIDDVLGKSLFEQLFIELRKREEKDGIQRTVTLDEQYRMHPLLGDFVSAQFYAPHGEGFRSPTPAEEFVHGLPGYGGPAAWLSVPRELGAERPGQSKSRDIEAELVVQELVRLMDAEEGRNLTFGVISFYAAQIDSIGKALEAAGVARKAGKAWEIAEPYRELRLKNGRIAERLRFGTVDAFQGMEFDVVFLSMVRSNELPDATKKQRRARFGHLTSPNRLCVAMSRQKRLLVIAGDETMLHGPNASLAIGPLVDFRQLCEVRHASSL
ncbi:hypothetical protein WM26_16130 [Burkholderia cepacia]|uniref:DEAD/DEAH box helicase n=1 Tax=Burkholderia cepacia TaxID=292 RepID=UPI00075F95A1|nr:AAA domain-containing protein [Burkholderia cepacia]KWO11897.1 hypothetical protein WM26_16130 [Burkholderia cepacia]